jgi:hypothetical protein
LVGLEGACTFYITVPVERSESYSHSHRGCTYRYIGSVRSRVVVVIYYDAMLIQPSKRHKISVTKESVVRMRTSLGLVDFKIQSGSLINSSVLIERTVGFQMNRMGNRSDFVIWGRRHRHHYAWCMQRNEATHELTTYSSTL